MLNEAIINDRARAPSVIGGSLDDGTMRHEGRAHPAACRGTRSHEGPPCSPRSTTDIGAPVWSSTPNPIGCEAAVKLKSLEPGLWWSQAGSNRRPLECHSSALPAELWPHGPERAAADRVVCRVATGSPRSRPGVWHISSEASSTHSARNGPADRNLDWPQPEGGQAPGGRARPCPSAQASWRLRACPPSCARFADDHDGPLACAISAAPDLQPAGWHHPAGLWRNLFLIGRNLG